MYIFQKILQQKQNLEFFAHNFQNIELLKFRISIYFYFLQMTQRSNQDNQNMSYCTVKTKRIFTPPQYPAHIITSDFQSPHILRLQKKFDEMLVVVCLQTSKSKISNKINDSTVNDDKYFIVLDDSQGGVELTGQFITNEKLKKRKVVRYPITNNLEKVLKQFEKYVGLGKYVEQPFDDDGEQNKTKNQKTRSQQTSQNETTKKNQKPFSRRTSIINANIAIKPKIVQLHEAMQQKGEKMRSKTLVQTFKTFIKGKNADTLASIQSQKQIKKSKSVKKANSMDKNNEKTGIRLIGISKLREQEVDLKLFSHQSPDQRRIIRLIVYQNVHQSEKFKKYANRLARKIPTKTIKEISKEVNITLNRVQLVKVKLTNQYHQLVDIFKKQQNDFHVQIHFYILIGEYAAKRFLPQFKKAEEIFIYTDYQKDCLSLMKDNVSEITYDYKQMNETLRLRGFGLDKNNEESQNGNNSQFQDKFDLSMIQRTNKKNNEMDGKYQQSKCTVIKPNNDRRSSLGSNVISCSIFNNQFGLQTINDLEQQLDASNSQINKLNKQPKRFQYQQEKPKRLDQNVNNKKVVVRSPESFEVLEPLKSFSSPSPKLGQENNLISNGLLRKLQEQDAYQQNQIKNNQQLQVQNYNNNKKKQPRTSKQNKNDEQKQEKKRQSDNLQNQIRNLKPNKSKQQKNQGNQSRKLSSDNKQIPNSQTNKAYDAKYKNVEQKQQKRRQSDNLQNQLRIVKKSSKQIPNSQTNNFNDQKQKKQKKVENRPLQKISVQRSDSIPESLSSIDPTNQRKLVNQRIQKLQDKYNNMDNGLKRNSENVNPHKINDQNKLILPQNSQRQSKDLAKSINEIKLNQRISNIQIEKNDKKERPSYKRVSKEQIQPDKNKSTEPLNKNNKVQNFSNIIKDQQKDRKSKQFKPQNLIQHKNLLQNGSDQQFQQSFISKLHENIEESQPNQQISRKNVKRQSFDDTKNKEKKFINLSKHAISKPKQSQRAKQMNKAQVPTAKRISNKIQTPVQQYYAITSNENRKDKKQRLSEKQQSYFQKQLKPNQDKSEKKPNSKPIEAQNQQRIQQVLKKNNMSPENELFKSSVSIGSQKSKDSHKQLMPMRKISEKSFKNNTVYSSKKLKEQKPNQGQIKKIQDDRINSIKTVNSLKSSPSQKVVYNNKPYQKMIQNDMIIFKPLKSPNKQNSKNQYYAKTYTSRDDTTNKKDLKKPLESIQINKTPHRRILSPRQNQSNRAGNLGVDKLKNLKQVISVEEIGSPSNSEQKTKNIQGKDLNKLYLFPRNLQISPIFEKFKHGLGPKDSNYSFINLNHLENQIKQSQDIFEIIYVILPIDQTDKKVLQLVQKCKALNGKVLNIFCLSLRSNQNQFTQNQRRDIVFMPDANSISQIGKHIPFRNLQKGDFQKEASFGPKSLKQQQKSTKILLACKKFNPYLLAFLPNFQQQINNKCQKFQFFLPQELQPKIKLLSGQSNERHILNIFTDEIGVQDLVNYIIEKLAAKNVDLRQKNNWINLIVVPKGDYYTETFERFGGIGMSMLYPNFKIKWITTQSCIKDTINGQWKELLNIKNNNTY